MPAHASLDIPRCSHSMVPALALSSALCGNRENSRHSMGWRSFHRASHCVLKSCWHTRERGL